MSLAANIVDDNGEATTVVWCTDGTFTTAIGASTIAGGSKGLKPVVMNDASKWFTVGNDGNIFVMVGKSGANKTTTGTLVVFYFPHPGF